MAALYIQAEAGGPAWRVWPDAEMIPGGAVREAASYIFELRDADAAVDADLFIDDMPVEALRSRHACVAKWRWAPGFHAGVVEAVLHLPGVGTRRIDVTTDPDLRKLTRDDFDAMVRELLEDTFALFSLSSFRRGIARQPGNKPPAIARLEFLRSRAEEIAETVAAIVRTPRHFLQAEDISLPVHRAMRATGPEILRSFRSGKILAETASPSRLPTALQGRLPAHITVRQRRSSVDIAEHRQIKACLRSWSAWLANMSEVLARIRPTDDEDIAKSAGAWTARTRHLGRQLAAAAESGFMREVGEAPAALSMSSLFRNDPVYRRFYRLWQDMNMGLAAIFGDFLQMPLARTYDLYELWCFLRLLRAATAEFGPAGVDVSGLFITEATGSITIVARSVIVPIGSGNVLCFQRRYREYWSEADRQGTYSRTMVPDLVLAGTGLGGGVQRVIVLDAKYRINDGLNDALSSIHTYRDALVRELDTGRTQGIVTAAYLLTPFIPALTDEFEGMPMPGRLFHPAYREKFRFGAVTLRPGMDASQLRAALKTIVADATGVP